MGPTCPIKAQQSHLDAVCSAVDIENPSRQVNAAKEMPRLKVGVHGSFDNLKEAGV